MKAIVVVIITFLSIQASLQAQNDEVTSEIKQDIKAGAERTELYFPLLRNKVIAVVANQSSVVRREQSEGQDMGQSKVRYTNLVDTLQSSGFKIKEIFCPEHGFRGNMEAGEDINNYTDKKTGLKVISLYGKNKKPTKESLKGVDMVVYDLQDVGVRFFTYISTLQYVMEACAEEHIPLLILDRPDPNGYYIDGPILEKDCQSFVGMDPVPIVYGMTAAEYARMINGEGWLKGGIQCDLKYIRVENYEHSLKYDLPVAPSPNLSDMEAVYLYPSLGLFEGTVMSVGRGTDLPFQLIGQPDLENTNYSFTPHSIKGKSLNPPYKNVLCHGYNLKEFADIYIKHINELYLYWLISSYKELKDKTHFFNNYFDKLAGTTKLKQQIMQGLSAEEIRKSWMPGIEKFKRIRIKYLLYPDF